MTVPENWRRLISSRLGNGDELPGDDVRREDYPDRPYAMFKHTGPGVQWDSDLVPREHVDGLVEQGLIRLEWPANRFVLTAAGRVLFERYQDDAEPTTGWR